MVQNIENYLRTSQILNMVPAKLKSSSLRNILSDTSFFSILAKFLQEFGKEIWDFSTFFSNIYIVGKERSYSNDLNG